VGDVRGQELDFHLLGDEVGKSLRLDSGVRDIPDVMTHELESPLGDSSHDIEVANDVSQHVRGDDHDLVVGEVVQELSDHHQHSLQKLLHLGISSLGVGEYLTGEVHRSLNLQGTSRLLLFDDESGTHNIVVCCDVEEEGFSLFRSDEDW